MTARKRSVVWQFVLRSAVILGGAILVAWAVVPSIIDEAALPSQSVAYLGASIVFLAGVLLFVNRHLTARDFFRPLDRVADVAGSLAKGDLDIEIPEQDRAGAIGGIARAIEALKWEIGARTAAEAALRQSDLRLRNLTRNVPGVVYQRVLHTDASVTYPFVSAGVRDIFGLEPQEIIADAKVFQDAVYEEDREDYSMRLKASAETMSARASELRVVHRNGSLRWVRCSEEYARIYGKSVEEFLRQVTSVHQLAKMFHPDDHQLYMDAITEGRTKGTACSPSALMGQIEVIG